VFCSRYSELAPTFFFSSRRRHTRSKRDWSSDVCSSDLDLGLPLPAGTRVHVYTTREAFRRGLVQDAAMGEEGANELAAFAIGIARPGRALLNGRLAGGGREWLRLIAHELTHVAQFELAGGEGRAEQWLAAGMAERVA